MNTPLVHVLVINWNGMDHLDACFSSLLASNYPNARFVLIDNASTDGSVAFVRERFGSDTRVEVVSCESNLGWSRGNNVGIERALDAGAEYIVLLNNDTWTGPDAIARMVEGAECDRTIGAIAPKMLLYDEPAIINSLGLECSIIGCGWDMSIGRLDGERWSAPREVIGVCGGACLIRAEAIRKAGLLPTDYDIYLDDLDLSLRIWNAGYTIWNCPAAVVHHKFSATMGSGERYRRKYFLNTRNRFRLIQRCFPLSTMVTVLPALVLGEIRAIGRGVLEGAWWKLGVHARAWLESIAYTGAALAHRHNSRRRGLGHCRFWRLVRHSPLFFPGVPLPERGWYPPVKVNWRAFRPISHRALATCGGRGLRVFHMNCYPALGVAEIDVYDGDTRLATLSNRGIVDEQVFETQSGSLEFRPKRIFWAEETGEAIDIGGWLYVEPA